MASIFFLLRGHVDHANKFIENMKSQTFPMNFKYKAKNPIGEDVDVNEVKNIEGVMKPIQIWEYQLPEQFVEPICRNLEIPTNETWFNKKPGEQTGSFISGFGAKGILEGLRLGLGAEKLPKLDLTKQPWPIPIYKQHINILGIGWRKDEYGKDSAGMDHELL